MSSIFKHIKYQLENVANNYVLSLRPPKVLTYVYLLNSSTKEKHDKCIK